uniref:Amelotin n=1 Tax=Monopterus albus TaxID=43700 RepID=A0A3Q3IL26_MONAL
MIIVILFSFFTVMVSAVPVSTILNIFLYSQGGATQAERVQPDAATNQKAETPAPFTPNVEQPQLAAPQLLTPQGGPQIVPSVHQYTWSPIGGSPVIIPLQPNIYGFLPANQPAVPQQPLSPPPGTLSSEELELGVYMPTVLTNLPTGAVQPVSQATRLTNPEQQGIVPNGGMLSAGVPQTQGLTNCQPQPHANSVPAGLEQAAQDVATVQTHAQPKLQPTHG